MRRPRARAAPPLPIAMRPSPATLLPALLLASTAFALVRGQEEAVLVHALEGRVSWLSGKGGNVGLSVGQDGVLMVDSQYAVQAPSIEKAIVALAGAKPVLLVNTHWHGDHTGGNAHFGAAATIVAQANVRRRLARDASIGGRLADEVREDALPVVTYEDGLSLFFNGEEVRLLHVPHGHTDGDSVVWFKGSNVVHMGDLFFQRNYPYIDLDSGGSVQGYLDGVESVLRWIPADARVIPGHGEATDVLGLREYRDMLAALVERVREGLAAGLSADDMVAGRLSEDFDARWGGSSFVTPERFVRTLASDLGREER